MQSSTPSERAVQPADHAAERPHAAEESDAARGAVLLPTLPAAPEGTPQVKAVLEEVPRHLGVPFVSPVFQALAGYPDYLVPAWERFRPVLDSPAFAEAAGRLRAPAGLLPGPAPFPGVDAHDLETIRRYSATFQALLPELLLLASCWYRGLTGGEPAAGPPVTASPPRPPKPDALNLKPPKDAPGPELAAVYAEIQAAHDHPRVLSYYKALGTWPGFTTTLWGHLGPLTRTPAYAAARTDLLARAAAAAATLPAPVVRTDADDDVRAILALFRTRLIPALLLDSAVVLALLGDHADAPA